MITSLKHAAYELIARAYVICDTQTAREMSFMRVPDVCQKAMVDNALDISEHMLHGVFHKSNTETVLIERNKTSHKLLFLLSSLRTLEKTISLRIPTPLIAIPESAPSKAK